MKGALMSVWKSASWVLAGLLPAMVLAPMPSQAGAASLATYRAVYDLVLDRSDQNSNLIDVTGRIVMEFTGSRCSGYKASLRFVTDMAFVSDMTESEGTRRVTDARTESFEGPSGKDFTFKNQTFIDDALAEESEGNAQRGGKGVSVLLTKPDDKKINLQEAVVFPTEQIERIIEAARQDRNFLQMNVYDGSENGETVYATAVVIGDAIKTADKADDEQVAKEAGVAGLTHWPVTVSYFDEGKGGEQMPVYVMSFVLYENGISRHLKIDYGDFAIVGQLSDLDMLSSEPCP